MIQVILLIEENQGTAGTFPPQKGISAPQGEGRGVSVWEEPPASTRVCAQQEHPSAQEGVEAKAPSVFKGKVRDREGSLQLHVPLADVVMQEENPSFLLFCQF